MAIKNSLCLLLLLLSSSLFVTIQAVRTNNQPKPSHVLSKKGYHAMALTLDTIHLESLIPTQLITDKNATFTIFCPKDQAFLASKYPQPPLTLLKYHIVPFKVDKNTFKSHGSKMDTLLPGHPLVVTSLSGGPYASLNQVKVAEWDLYNDGQLIIHGVDDFFDPAFQILRYPQYDPKINVKKIASSNWLMEATENWVLLSLVAAASIAMLIIVFIFCGEPTKQHKDDAQIPYAPLY